MPMRQARRRPLGLAVAFATIASLVPALATAGAGHERSARTGLYGQATKGPLTPVCREDVPCYGPASRARLLFVRRGRVIARTRTRGDGSYRIVLRAGRYQIRSKIGFGVVKPPAVTVRRGHFSKLDLLLDTGIR